MKKVEEPKSPDPLSERLIELKLSHWQEAMTADLDRLDPQTRTTIVSHVRRWADTELAKRHSTTIASRIRQAKFIRPQTVDDFDFDYNKSTRAAKPTYMPLFNETTKGALPRAVFVGTAGLGKTHLARALGYGACQARTSVLYTVAAKIVNKLATAKVSHRLEAELDRYRRPRLLIVDELGYVNMDLEATNLFYQVISSRHDEGFGTIVTTNVPFGEWNQIFTGDHAAQVIVDRLTDGAEIFYFEGVSYREARTKKAKKTTT